MTRRYGSLLTGVLMVLTLTVSGGGQTPADALFQEGLMLERAEGKLREAIVRYERVVSEFPDDRPVVAKALLQLGGIYERLKRPDARQTYEQILRDFADVVAAAADARTRLAALPGAPPARAEGVTSRKLLTGPGADRYGSVSRDGRFLSFTDRTSGDLAIRDLRTGEVRRITNNPAGSKEFAEYSVFSPDGARLAYGWYNTRGEYELRVISREGGEPRQLHAQQGVSWLEPYDWSPDAREILMILPREDRTRQLILVSVSDGSIRVLKTLDWNMGVPWEAQFSPDGQTIVYDRGSAEQNSDTDVFMLSVDGSRETALASGPAQEFFLGWFPDGKAVLFSSDQSGTPGAWVVDVDERGPVGDPRLLKPDIGRLNPKGFTRGGEFFYFKNVGGPDVYLAEIDPTSTRVTRPPAPLKERFPDGRMWASWSPDGEHLAYRPIGLRPLVAIHNVSTGVVRSVPLQMDYLGPRPNWTVNGFLVSGLDALARAGIYRADLATGAVAPIVTGAQGLNVQFNPDGTLLLYVQFGDAHQPPTTALVVRNMKTGATRELYRGDSVPGFALSPDGHSVGIRVRTEAARAVRIIDLPSGASRTVLPLTADDVGTDLAWTPDGTALLLARGKDSSELWRVPVNGGQPAQLDLRLPGMLSISVNPDGRRLAIVANQQTPEVWVLQNLNVARGGR